MYKLKKLFPLRLHLKLVWESVFSYPERKQQWSTPKEAGLWKCIFKIHNSQQKLFYFLFSLSLFFCFCFFFILSARFFTRGVLLWKKKQNSMFSFMFSRDFALFLCTNGSGFLLGFLLLFLKKYKEMRKSILRGMGTSVLQRQIWTTEESFVY